MEFTRSHSAYTRFELEVGCGDGRFLQRQAKARPLTQFVGVDIRDGPLQAASVRVRDLENIEYVCADATDFLLRSVDQSFDCLHIYFPTPYAGHSATKSTKYVDFDFMAAALPAIRPGGEIRVISDHPDVITEVMRFAIWTSCMVAPWVPVTPERAGFYVDTYWEERVLASSGRSPVAVRLVP